jgi:hypothetical protein
VFGCKFRWFGSVPETPFERIGRANPYEREGLVNPAFPWKPSVETRCALRDASALNIGGTKKRLHRGANSVVTTRNLFERSLQLDCGFGNRGGLPRSYVAEGCLQLRTKFAHHRCMWSPRLIKPENRQPVSVASSSKFATYWGPNCWLRVIKPENALCARNLCRCGE